VFRALGVEYLHRDELAQVPPERVGLPEPPSGMALEAGMQLDLTDAAMESDIEAQVQAAAFVDATTITATATVVDDAHATVATATRAVTEVAATNGGGTAVVSRDVQTAAVQAVLADKMGDAPLCDTCGHITVRNGSCYRCLNCGDSKGCS
jgi:ribonucleoside-diphosphate reductase alpha chain